MSRKVPAKYEGIEYIKPNLTFASPEIIKFTAIKMNSIYFIILFSSTQISRSTLPHGAHFCNCQKQYFTFRYHLWCLIVPKISQTI